MKIKYFWLTKTYRKKITGMANGAAQAILDKSCFADADNYEYYSWYMHGKGYIDRIFRLPKREFNLECVKMAKESKLTDFISCCDVNWGFIVSDRVVTILQDCDLPKHHFYPVTVYHNEQKYENYRYFYMEALGAEYVDFEKSSFYVGKITRIERIEDIQLSNPDEYHFKAAILKAQNPMLVIKPERLVFNTNFNTEWDIFWMKELTHHSYISKSLVNVFKKHKITGYEIGWPALGPKTIEVPESLQTVE